MIQAVGRGPQSYRNKKKSFYNETFPKKNQKTQWFRQPAGGRRFIETKKNVSITKHFQKKIKNTVIQAVGGGPQSYSNKKKSFYNQTFPKKKHSDSGSRRGAAEI